MYEEQFPYDCIHGPTGVEFTPTMIDYDNLMVWHQQGQASGSGEWYPFSDVLFIKNKKFKCLELRN